MVATIHTGEYKNVTKLGGANMLVGAVRESVERGGVRGRWPSWGGVATRSVQSISYTLYTQYY